MKAIILAAGKSRRLRPLTHKTPKCLLLIRGERALIDYQIEALLRNGVDYIVVIVGFKAGKIQSYLTRRYDPELFTFIKNKKYERTGPAFSLWLARKHLKGTVLYLNADVLYRSNIVKRVIKSPFASATAVQKTPWDKEAVKVNIHSDPSSQITEIGKHIPKEKKSWEFIGVTKFGSTFNSKLIDVLKDFVKNDEINKFAADAINETIRRGEEMHIVDTSDLETIEIDTRDDLKRARRKWHAFARHKHHHPLFSAKGTWGKLRYIFSKFKNRK